LNGQPDDCSTNGSYEPVGEWPPGDEGQYPVTSVNWCDAYMYCKGVGKRLCGKIGGGAETDTATGQWTNACSSGGANKFPYGNSYQGTSCNGKDAGKGGTVAVGSMPDCVSTTAGYEGVYDQSGNAYEWVDDCSSGWCLSLGGSYDTAADGWPNYLACDAGGSMAAILASSTVGFRCCSD
jgi:formylglycine-generating enzyme